MSARSLQAPLTVLAAGVLVAAAVVFAQGVFVTVAFGAQPRMMASELDLSPVVTIVCILVWTTLVGPMGALLAVPLTITMRAILPPYPGDRWFVALLGPVPEDPGLPTS